MGCFYILTYSMLLQVQIYINLYTPANEYHDSAFCFFS